MLTFWAVIWNFIDEGVNISKKRIAIVFRIESNDVDNKTRHDLNPPKLKVTLLVVKRDTRVLTQELISKRLRISKRISQSNEPRADFRGSTRSSLLSAGLDAVP